MESAKGRNKLRNNKYKISSGTTTVVSHILAWLGYTGVGLSILFLFDLGFSAGYIIFLH